jgi:hypothetical protein
VKGVTFSLLQNYKRSKCISPWLGEKMRYSRQLYVQKKNSEMGNNEAAKSYKQKKIFLILQTLF